MGALFGPVALYILVALGLSYTPTFPGKHTCTDEKTVYVSTNGVHLEVIIPTDLLDSALNAKMSPPSGSIFVSMGWGDRGFFINTPTWTDLTVGTALSALFIKTRSAMHTTFYKSKRKDWRPVVICPEQLKALNKFVSGAFKQTDDLQLMIIPGASYGRNDRFYEANGYYTMFNTCNVWVNDALKKANVRTSIWSPFDFGVLFFIDQKNQTF